jgi:hypothetical protein
VIICTGSRDTSSNQWLCLHAPDVMLSRPYQYVSSVVRAPSLCVSPKLENVQSGFLQPVIDSYCVIMLRSVGMTGSCLCGYSVDTVTASLAYFIGIEKELDSFFN